MSELVHQLGLDWKLLLSQAVNFFILLLALTYLVYRPLLKIIEERRKKIELGLTGAREAENKLREIDKMREEKIVEADKNALKIVGDAEKTGQERMEEILKNAEKRAEEIVTEAARVAEHRKQEELNRLAEKANLLVKEAIIKTVELDPRAIDEKLISQAVQVISAEGTRLPDGRGSASGGKEKV